MSVNNLAQNTPSLIMPMEKDYLPGVFHRVDACSARRVTELRPAFLLTVQISLCSGSTGGNGLFNFLGQRGHETKESGHCRLHSFLIALFHDPVLPLRLITSQWRPEQKGQQTRSRMGGEKFSRGFRIEKCALMSGALAKESYVAWLAAAVEAFFCR